MADFLIQTLTTGSSFQVRYASFGSLVREPLGTIPMMQQVEPGVNRDFQFDERFTQALFHFVSACYGLEFVDFLCIKRGRLFLFEASFMKKRGR